MTDGDKLFVLTSDRRQILDAMERQFVFSLGIGNLVHELDGKVRRIAGKAAPGNFKREAGVERKKIAAA